MNDFVINDAVAQYDPHAAAKYLALFVIAGLIPKAPSPGKAANKYVNVKASSISDNASTKRG